MKKLFCLSFFLLFVLSVFGQKWIDVNEFNSCDGLTYYHDNTNSSICNNYAIVGASFNSFDEFGENYIEASGSAYIFERDNNGNWSKVQKIVASDRDEINYFGASVSISGKTIIVGASLNDGYGAAYIFDRNENGEWIETQKLTANLRTHSGFGNAVSICTNRVIVGAFNDYQWNLNLHSSGSAYIFEKNETGTWRQVKKLIASDRASYDYFGISVSINDSYAIVGSYNEDLGNNSQQDAGCAYIFEIGSDGSWNREIKITPYFRCRWQRFGYSVSISGKYAVIGTFMTDTAYVFERKNNGNWILQQSLFSNDSSTYYFGQTLSITYKYILVGAQDKHPNPYNTNSSLLLGTAYVFERDEHGYWNESQKVVNSCIDSFYNFGYSVSVFYNFALVAGSAYTYDNLKDSFISSGSSIHFLESEFADINEVNRENLITYYPNPTKDFCKINLGKKHTDINIIARNILRQIVLSKQIKDTQKVELNINGTSGIYFVEISTQDGKSTVIKLLKE